MSASPEPQAASPDNNDVEKVATPTAGDEEVANEKEDVAGDDAGNEEEISDDESILSEVDEAQFENFDPENVEVDDRPQLAPDEENLKLIGRHKRKRAEGEEGRSRRKEGRRGKKRRDDEDGEAEGTGPSRRREKKKAAEPDTDEETLDPETRMYSCPMDLGPLNSYNSQWLTRSSPSSRSCHGRSYEETYQEKSAQARWHCM